MATEDAPAYRWYQKLTGVLYVILCFEIGLFLVFFPWSEFWKPNWLGNWSTEWGMFWMNPYVRGAVSGLGVVNIVYSIMETFRLRRFSQSESAAEDQIDNNEGRE